MESELVRLTNVVAEISKNYTQLHDAVEAEALEVLNDTRLKPDNYFKPHILDIVGMLADTVKAFARHTAELLQLLEHNKDLPLVEWQRRYEQLLDDLRRDKSKLALDLRRDIQA